MTGQSGKTAGATKPAPTGVPSLGPSGTATSPPSVGPVMGAPVSLAEPPPPPGTPGRGTAAAKSDKSHGKTLNGSKADKNQVAGPTAKAKDSGKTDPKIQKPVNDKAGKAKP